LYETPGVGYGWEIQGKTGAMANQPLLHHGLSWDVLRVILGGDEEEAMLMRVGTTVLLETST